MVKPITQLDTDFFDVLQKVTRTKMADFKFMEEVRGEKPEEFTLLEHQIKIKPSAFCVQFILFSYFFIYFRVLRVTVTHFQSTWLQEWQKFYLTFQKCL